MMTLGEENLLNSAMHEADELERVHLNDSHASIIRRVVDLVRRKDREIQELKLKVSSMKRKARMGIPVT